MAGSSCYSWIEPYRPSWWKRFRASDCVSWCPTTKFDWLYFVRPNLQVHGHVAICCPADLNTKSATLSYILRECGSDKIFQLRPTVGEVLNVPSSLFLKDNQVVHLLIARPSQRSPEITDDFFMLGSLESFIIVQRNPWCSLPHSGPWAPTSQLGQFLS